MNDVQAMMNRLNGMAKSYEGLSYDELERKKVEWNNNAPGTLKDVDCPLCMNRGYTAELRNGRLVEVRCKCMNQRNALVHIRKSGLGDLLERCTFDTYKVSEDWQRIALEMARDYAQKGKGWFVASGCPGSGKTHLCTAICKELLDKGKSVRYMLWRDVGVQLKALVNDESYARTIEPYKKADVLYIDDFLKTGKGQEPTHGDLNLAHELINSRYNNSGLVTIISTELSLKKILALDEAVGSRICEKSEDNYLRFTGQKNQRIKGLCSK